jgi:type IV secretory pathway TraG/TraD family ATPase VirD4
LYHSRYATLNEVHHQSLPKEDIVKKKPVIYLGVGKHNRLLVAQPRKSQKEIGHILIPAKTRRGKSLNADTNALNWPYPLIFNDIKKEHWHKTAGWRGSEEGLGGKSLLFDPRGYGVRYDPLEGMTTESELLSAATILLYRANEGQNQFFTDSAITMLKAIFIAARLEGLRPFPFTYTMMNEGFYGAATILKIITEKFNYYPDLAKMFLDIEYDKADFNSRSLRDGWSTLTRRMRRILTKESVRCFSGCDFTPKDIITSGKNPISLYLNWPERHLTAFAPLSELVLDSIINGMTEYHDDVLGVGCYPTLAILDECMRMKMAKLSDYAETTNGRGITLFVPVQSDSQLYDAYGQYKAEAFKEQFDYIIHYRPAPAGNRAAQNIETSLGYKSGYAQNKTDHEHGSSEGESEQRVSLMSSSEAKHLEDEHVVIEIDGQWPTIAKRMNLHDFPELVKRVNWKTPIVTELAERPTNGVYRGERTLFLRGR